MYANNERNDDNMRFVIAKSYLFVSLSIPAFELIQSTARLQWFFLRIRDEFL